MPKESERTGEKSVKSFAIEVSFCLWIIHFLLWAPFRMLKDYKAGFTISVVVSASFLDIFTNKYFTCKEIYNVTMNTELWLA